MARLIDADRALEIVRDQGIAHPNAYHLTNYATLILREAPTVDAVPVVRCRDCKHWDSETWFCDNHSTFSHHGLEWNMFSEDDFCSYGERKDCDRIG